jgi:hypothetical protein
MSSPCADHWTALSCHANKLSIDWRPAAADAGLSDVTPSASPPPCHVCHTRCILVAGVVADYSNLTLEQFWTVMTHKCVCLSACQQVLAALHCAVLAADSYSHRFMSCCPLINRRADSCCNQLVSLLLVLVLLLLLLLIMIARTPMQTAGLTFGHTVLMVAVWR